MAEEETISYPFDPPHDRPWTFSEFLWWLEGRVVIEHIPRLEGAIFATVLEVRPGLIRVQLENNVQVIVPTRDHHEPRPGTRVLLTSTDEGISRSQGFTPRRVNRPTPVLGGAFVPPAQPGQSGFAWPDVASGGQITLGAFQGRSWLPYQGVQPADPTLETRGPAFAFVYCPQDRRERVPGDVLGRYGSRFGEHNPNPSPQFAHTVSPFVIGPSEPISNHRGGSAREGLSMVLPMTPNSPYPNVGRVVWWGIPMPFDKRGVSNRLEPTNPIATELGVWDVDTVYVPVESLKTSSLLHGINANTGQPIMHNTITGYEDYNTSNTSTIAWRTVRNWTVSTLGNVLFRFPDVGSLGLNPNNSNSTIVTSSLGFMYRMNPMIASFSGDSYRNWSSSNRYFSAGGVVVSGFTPISPT